MNFKEWLLNENVVAQELKKVPNETLQKLKQQAENIFNDLFQFKVEEKKKQELTNWIAYNLQHEKDLSQSLRQNIDYLIARLNNINFKTTDYTVEKMKEESAKYHENLKKTTKIGSRGAYGKTLISFPDGWKWLDLEKGFCSIEAGAMGHCGNAAGQYNKKHNIFSLRDPRNIPYLTFVDEGDGVLGEMKGRFNNKPESQFHPYIIELLKHPRVKKVKGGGYKPEYNFMLSDLNQEQYDDVLQAKPNILMHPLDVIKDNPSYIDHDAFITSMVQHKMISPSGELAHQVDNEIEKHFKPIKRDKYHIIAACLAANKMPIEEPLRSKVIKMFKVETADAADPDQTLNQALWLVNAAMELVKKLVPIYENNKELFQQIWNVISPKAKAMFVYYAVSTNMKLTDDLYKAIDSTYLKKIENEKDSLPKLPTIITQLIQKDKEYQSIGNEYYISLSTPLGEFLDSFLHRYDYNLYNKVVRNKQIELKNIPAPVATATILYYATQGLEIDKKDAYKLMAISRVDYKLIRLLGDFIRKINLGFFMPTRSDDIRWYIEYFANFLTGVGQHVDAKQDESSPIGRHWYFLLNDYLKYPKRTPALDNTILMATQQVINNYPMASNTYKLEDYVNQIKETAPDAHNQIK